MTRVFWIWVGSANDNPCDSRRFNGRSARRRATVGATRLQRHVKRGPAWIVSASLRIAQRFDFCMGHAGLPMPAASDDLTAPNQNGAHHRIGRRRAETTPRQL
jgi:hypothetical protein